MDLYQRLGIKRGASEAEVKKAYRSLAKQLHPDRNTDTPKAAERFAQITAAYDLLSDKDKRARYDRGEIDEDGNPRMPFGGGFGGGGAGPRPGSGGYEGFPGGFSADTADLSDLFEGLFGAAASSRTAKRAAVTASMAAAYVSNKRVAVGALSGSGASGPPIPIRKSPNADCITLTA